MAVETFDGEGGISRWEIHELTRRKVSLKHLESRKVQRQAPVRLTLGLNPLKGGNEEYAIRMAAAMEVERIVAVFFARSDVKVDVSSMKNRIERWRKLAISEVAQSGGAYLPDISESISFGELIESSKEPGILFDEESDETDFEMELSSGMEIIALVGPEGGIERSESDLAREAEWHIASLGPWTLRADLASALVPSWVYGRV